MSGLCQLLLHLGVSKQALWRKRIIVLINDEQDMKFILLHEGKNDEGIRGFFTEVWELYVKVRGMIQRINESD
jgi:Sedlin, N-terminal conserved region